MLNTVEEVVWSDVQAAWIDWVMLSCYLRTDAPSDILIRLWK